ncbi:MAG: LPXTG cell wall anchor domain-containing protein [Aristaeellaceae bacterium]
MKKLMSIVLVLVLMAQQLSGLSALAESDATLTFPRFEVEEGISEQEYAQNKQEFVNQLNGGGSNWFTSRALVRGNTLSNEYIEFAVNSSTGRFTVGTVEGNPALSTDNNKILLYGHSNPTTSYTTVCVDGTPYIYGNSGFTQSPYFDAGTNANYSGAMFGNISVQQVIRIVENSATQREDVVEIQYIVTNTGSSTASLGLRVMMDTMLGSNDAAPFRIPGYGNLTTEMEFAGDSIPQYWQAFDSLTDPQVVSYGSLLCGSIRPDKVQFTNWRRIYNTPWDYSPATGISNGDSAVSIIWERTLAAGAQETYVTRYGLSELIQDLQPPLGVTISSASRIETNAARDDYLPYPITIYVQNLGTAVASNATCTIELPEGLAFADTGATTAVYKLGTMNVGAVGTIEKNVVVSIPYNSEVNKQYKVTVSATNASSKVLTRDVTIGALDVDVLTRSGQFKYPGMINGLTDSTATYHYSDLYFYGDARAYNSQLATMSLCLELSSWSSFDTGVWANKTKNARALLNEIGFDAIEQNGVWDDQPTMNSIGLIAAYKNIGNMTVVALAVRGGAYYDEWGGNFVLGPSDNHEGFEAGAQAAYNYLNGYMAKHKANGEFKNEVKLWIVGYSRGGAVANMTAGRITDALSCGGVALQQKNIFAYTFEAPQGYVGVDSPSGYCNIHNLINPMDLIPLVAPSVMGFKRYNTNSIPLLPSLGTTEYYNDISAIRTQFENVCKGIPGGSTATYNPNPFAMQVDFKLNASVSAGYKTWEFLWFSGKYPYVSIDINPQWLSRNRQLTVDAMLEGSVNTVFTNIPNGRIGYVNNVENALSSLITFFMSYNSTIDWLAVLNDAFFSNYAEGARKIVGILLYPLDTPKTKIQRAAAAATELIINSALKQTGTNLEEVKTALVTLLQTVFSTFIDSPQQFFSFLYYLIADNGFQPHWPEVTLAAMMSADSNYTSQPRSVRQRPQSYRIVHINCPVDVVVYDESMQVMSRIDGDSVTNTSSVHGAAILDTGAKQIILPSDAAYTIRINATGKGEMSVSVMEYDSIRQQYTLLQGWQNLSIDTGDSFDVDIPAYAGEDYIDADGDGSATVYRMTEAAGREIVPTLSLRGDGVTCHQVTLSTNNQKGMVTGGGQYVTSCFAQVEAMAMPSVDFLGWYVNGVCVSTEESYRFAVNEDVELVAHFSEGNFNQLSVTATAGGTVNVSEMELPETVQLQLIAEADPGFAFDHWEVSAGDIEDAQSATTLFTMPATDAAVVAVFKCLNELTITLQPVEQCVVVGQQATFTLEATGDGVTCQWYINRNNGNGWQAIDGAVDAAYTTSVTDLDCDGFRYYCAVADQYGNTLNSDEAELHVITAPVVPETGDSAAPMLWLAMMLLGALGLLLVRRKTSSR